MAHDALDGGWGWVVVFASFMSHTLIAALYFAYGVFTESWMIEFNASSGMTSLVGCTSSAFTSMAAPLGSYVLSRWGCRVTHMTGGILVTVGILLCSQATSLPQIFIFYGLIGGTGLGLCYVPAVIILSQYFKKRRGLAIGIASSGVGVGSFVFPIVLEALQVEYSWRGAMMLLSALMANTLVCAMVMFPVTKQDKPIKPTLRRRSVAMLRNLARHPWLRRQSSIVAPPMNPTNQREDIVEDYIGDVIFEEDEMSDSDEPNDLLMVKAGITASQQISVVKSTLSLNKFSHKESFASQSRVLFCDPVFYLMVLNNITMFVGMMLVFGLTPIRATRDLGFSSEQGAFFVSIIGLTTLVGRFSWGALSNIVTSVKPITMFIILRGIAAILTLLSPFATSYTLQMTYCTLVGLVFGAWSLYPIVLANLFGDRSLNTAFGYLEVFDGVGSLLGPTLGGILYDVTGSYNLSFIFSGATLAVGTLILIVGYCACARDRHSTQT